MECVVDGAAGAPGAGRRVAVLVDGENIGPVAVPAALELAQAMGRVYRNATAAREWEAQPGFLTVHTGDQRGKNAADIALVIKAVELALRGRADGFVLVSSDGDFTRLATWLRENGFSVVGVGAEKAPRAFRAACDAFRVVPVGGAAAGAGVGGTPRVTPGVTPIAAPANAAMPAAVSPKAAGVDSKAIPEGVLRKLDALLSAVGDGGWLSLGLLGSQMGTQHGVRIREIGGTTWRALLERWPHRYELEVKGPKARVRLRQRKA